MDAKPFRLSASKLKRFLQCPRAYFLRYVQGVEEDVGGNYLAVGTAYDLHVQHYLSAGARGVRSIDPRIVRMFDAARRYLPEPGSVEVQMKYAIPHPDGFVVEGTPDLRRPGWLGDTKTTSASGPGVGSAMTKEQLEADIQFRLYAWCEYQLGWAPDACVAGVWSYVNKDTKPKAWNVATVTISGVVNKWFDAVVRPAARAMAALEAEADAQRVTANLDSCDRCWTRAHCDPFDGPNSYDGVAGLIAPASLKRTRPVSPAGVGGVDMFDLKKLSEDVDLVPALEASLTAVAINPPRTTAQEDLAKARAFLASELAVDYAAELAEAIAQCQTAAQRAGELLARLRGGGR